MSERAFGSHVINVTHPDKVLFPRDGIRKQDVIDYYERIAEVMLPHIEDRPLMLQRFPNGIGEKGFYQKNTDFDHVRSFARMAAELLCSRYPKETTVAARKGQRFDRVYIDVLRNAYAQTAVAPYAMRAKPRAPVAAPLDWDELSDARLHSQRFNMKNIFRRIEKDGDPWKSIRHHPQAIDQAQEKLERMLSSDRRRIA